MKNFSDPYGGSLRKIRVDLGANEIVKEDEAGAPARAEATDTKLPALLFLKAFQQSRF